MSNGARVLVVDDGADLRDLERLLLEEAGYVVEEAEDGAAAIHALGERRPDLVLLDIVMPGIDGWGVLDFIATLPNPPRVIIVSGNTDIVPPGRLARFVGGYMFKPFDIDQFLKVCERGLVTAVPERIAESRKEPRRAFAAEATLLSEAGVPLAIGQLLDVSAGGFRVELGVPVRPGDQVRIAVRLPWQPTAMELRGQVRWRKGGTFGVDAGPSTEDDQRLLGTLLGTN